jgi:hypothetical protein
VTAGRVGKNIFACYSSNRGLISRIQKVLKQLNVGRIDNPGNKWANELNRQVSNEEI